MRKITKWDLIKIFVVPLLIPFNFQIHIRGFQALWIHGCSCINAEMVLGKVGYAILVREFQRSGAVACIAIGVRIQNLSLCSPSTNLTCLQSLGSSKSNCLPPNHFQMIRTTNRIRSCISFEILIVSTGELKFPPLSRDLLDLHLSQDHVKIKLDKVDLGSRFPKSFQVLISFGRFP